MGNNKRLLEALVVTYAAVGQEVSDAALEIVAMDLSTYEPEGVMAALSRCRKELRKISLADILARIPGGHPGADEAWALVARALSDEGPTVVWTDQVREAFGVALGLSDDPIAARMAFKECYGRLVAEAIERGEHPRWTASLGWDTQGRAAPVLAAVEAGRLDSKVAAALLPPTADVSERITALAERAIKRIGGPRS